MILPAPGHLLLQTQRGTRFHAGKASERAVETQQDEGHPWALTQLLLIGLDSGGKQLYFSVRPKRGEPSGCPTGVDTLSVKLVMVGNPPRFSSAAITMAILSEQPSFLQKNYKNTTLRIKHFKGSLGQNSPDAQNSK